MSPELVPILSQDDCEQERVLPITHKIKNELIISLLPYSSSGHKMDIESN